MRISPERGSGSGSSARSSGRESIGAWLRKIIARMAAQSIGALRGATACASVRGIAAPGGERRRSGAGVAATADAEEAQLVIGDAKPVRLPNATSQPREHVRLHEAAVHVLD